MSKKHFIALANMIKEHNRIEHIKFDKAHIAALARFCGQQNYNFKPDRWFAYIAGECGPNGGAVKA